LVRTPLDALPHLTLLQVKADAERLVGWGQPLYPAQVESIPAELEKGDRVRLGSEDGRLLAVAMALQTGTHVDRSRPGFKYLRVFA